MPRNLTKERQARDALAEALRADHQKWVEHSMQAHKRARRRYNLFAIGWYVIFGVLILAIRNQEEISQWIKSL